VVRTKRFLADCQGALVKRLGFCIAALVGIQKAQIPNGGGYVGMLGSEGRLQDCQASFEKWLGISVSALRDIQRSQIVEASGDLRVIGP
jgi:hypothetical protein